MRPISPRTSETAVSLLQDGYSSFAYDLVGSGYDRTDGFLQIDILLRSYAPFPLVLSFPQLKKCQRLVIDIDWSCFPPRYMQNYMVPLLTNCTSVVKLIFQARSAASVIDFFHIFWAIPPLVSCEFHVATQDTLTAMSLAKLEKILFSLKPRPILKDLMFNKFFVSSQH